MSNLLTERHVYKPFHYPWAFEAFETQHNMHWLPKEVPLASDVQDWNHKITGNERNLLTHIFRFFTQADMEVQNCYNRHYASVFKHPEVAMMLTAFSDMEGIHQHAYSYLLDTVQMPEIEYQAFMKYKAMKDKYDYMQQFDMKDKSSIAVTLAVFGAFTEGLQLFASFAILLNFPRFNKMKGMGQIVTWSVRDETLHCESIIKLFRTFIEENREIWNDELKAKLYEACRTIVSHEDAFIDLAFELGDIEGLKADEMKQYIRYIADRRLIQLGLKPNYKVKENPLIWLDEMLNAPEFMNFFEGRVTEYGKAMTTGSWDDAFSPKHNLTVYGKQDCPNCYKVKNILNAKNIAYIYIDITYNESLKQDLYKKYNKNQLPLIESNNSLLSIQDLDSL